jgi:hypothetical protein
MVNVKRQLNELSTLIEAYQRTNTREHAHIEERFDQLLVLVQQLSSTSSVGSPVQTMPPAGPVPFTVSNNKTDHTNLGPTPELIDIIQKVVAETHLCVGKKKGGADDNSFKVCMRPHSW